MMSNQSKTVSTILSRLENRLFLFRHSLSEENETGTLSENLTTKKTSSLMDENNQLTVDPSTTGCTLVLECCDIEAAVKRIFTELADTGSFETLKEVVHEYEEAIGSFEKHQKILESKRQSVSEQKKLLAAIREKQEPMRKLLYESTPPKRSERSEDNLSLVEQWMECRIESKKEFYDHLVGEIREKTENFERESRMQGHTDFQTVSFWLLKYESFTQTLDLLLRTIFDKWASKKREISILKKYRNFNLKKIERITKQIAQKEEVISADRKEQELELQREKEALRRRMAATLIQAHWRGTMVRKHLGPYKIKKKKKKKEKKGKKKGKK